MVKKVIKNIGKTAKKAIEPVRLKKHLAKDIKEAKKSISDDNVLLKAMKPKK